MRKIALATAVLGLIVMAGCSNPDAKIVGTWTNPAVTFQFDKDKTWSTTMAGAQTKGTWSLSDKTLTAKFTSISGKSIEDLKKSIPPAMMNTPQIKEQMKVLDNGMTMTLATDTTLEFQSPIPGQPKVTLTKQAQK